MPLTAVEFKALRDDEMDALIMRGFSPAKLAEFDEETRRILKRMEAGLPIEDLTDQDMVQATEKMMEK